MIVEYARYCVPRTRVDGFREAWAEGAVVLQSDPRCLAYEIAEAPDEPGRFVVRVEWQTASVSLATLAKDPNLSRLLTLVAPYAGDLVDTQRVAPLTISPSVPEKGLPTLYEWAGGHAAIERLLNAFYDRVERDSLLRMFFPHGVGRAHRQHVATWWSEVFGGPAHYTASLGGYPRMLAHHLGLNINADQRRQFVTLISLAADDAGLPDDPEFRAALVGYAEWATRLAMHNSRTGANVVRDAPVPCWGWGVAPPFIG